jgi:hypothetical protein
MNAGNLLAVDLGADGVYEVIIHLADYLRL